MRAGSLSQEPILSRLRNNYICGYRNIAKAPYSGNSGIHPLSGPAVTTTNGAGPRNLQLFILASDGTVLHCLPGYWQSKDMAGELDLAERLNHIWTDRSITPAQKEALFAREHIRHINSHSSSMVAASELQGFDRVHIFKHNIKDAIKDPASLAGADPHHLPREAFKSTDTIMHERLSKQPFVPYERFNVAQFVNYGSQHYDKGEHKIDPSAMASIRAHDLREVLYETWTPDEKKPAGSGKPAAVKAPVQNDKKGEKKAKKNVEVPVNMDETMTRTFWSYIEKGKYDKAERLANYKISRDSRNPIGYQMRSVLKYDRGDYQGSARDAYRAIQLGSKHPKLVWLYKNAMARLKAQRQMSVAVDNNTAVMNNNSP